MIQFNDRVQVIRVASPERSHLMGEVGTVKEVLPINCGDRAWVSVLLDSGGREWFFRFELEVIE